MDNKVVYIVESGKVEIEKKTGLLVFKADYISQEGYEELDDAIFWIEHRYGNPKRIGGFIWQSPQTDNAYRIKFITIKQRGSYEKI